MKYFPVSTIFRDPQGETCDYSLLWFDDGSIDSNDNNHNHHNDMIDVSNEYNIDKMHEFNNDDKKSN